ncbi:MAG TPA: chemotaxis protein CheB [Planctomycetaceae bacterium]|nr:chemotaxis protein CheB [Planctomycetaceae bacterium]
MTNRDLIVIGGSAGALEPLTDILQGLGSTFGGAVFVVVHTPADSNSALPAILARSTVLPVAYAVQGEAIVRGRVYVAPPDHHLLVQSGTITVTQGPRENGFRPAIDPLFRSAAKIYGDRVVGVILSGAMDDGTFGLGAIKTAGGVAIVQHPYEATTPSMPLSAIQSVEVDHIVRAREISQILAEASTNGDSAEVLPFPPQPEQPTLQESRDIELVGISPDRLAAREGGPSYYTCPECGGTLWELQEGGDFRFRCHTGHGFTATTLLAEQNGRMEHALWSAIRVLQERAALHLQLSRRFEQRGMVTAATRYSERANHEREQADLLRDFFSTDMTPADLPLPNGVLATDVNE